MTQFEINCVFNPHFLFHFLLPLLRVSQLDDFVELSKTTDCLPVFIAKGIALGSFFYARCLHMGHGVKKEKDLAQKYYSRVRHDFRIFWPFLLPWHQCVKAPYSVVLSFFEENKMGSSGRGSLSTSEFRKHVGAYQYWFQTVYSIGSLWVIFYSRAWNAFWCLPVLITKGIALGSFG